MATRDAGIPGTASARWRNKIPSTPPGWVVPLLTAIFYLAGWYTLDWVSAHLAITPGVSVWRPAYALGVVLLLVSGLRYAPLLLLASRAYELVGHAPALALPLFDLAGTLPLAAGCVLLLRRGHLDPRLPTLRDVALFVAVAAVLAPLVTAALQVALLAVIGTVPGREVPLRALQIWAGDATGCGMVAPTAPVAAAALAPRVDNGCCVPALGTRPAPCHPPGSCGGAG